jgi:uncharacterized HAD superfamily protein
MTVTLTIEQLRFYQDSLEKWTKDAMLAEHVARQVDVHGIGGIRSDRFDHFRKESEAWLEKNPMPKLVPKELEA